MFLLYNNGIERRAFTDANPSVRRYLATAGHWPTGWVIS